MDPLIGLNSIMPKENQSLDLDEAVNKPTNIWDNLMTVMLESELSNLEQDTDTDSLLKNIKETI